MADFPSRSDAVAATDTVLELVHDFPFVDASHRAAALAALLTPFAMTAYDGPTPLVAIDAPTAGTGKSLLADAVATLATGRVMARMAQAPNEEEERKRITATALGGDRLVLLDNITRPVGSGTLDAALTSDVWEDRLLGVNKNVRLSADTGHSAPPRSNPRDARPRGSFGLSFMRRSPFPHGRWPRCNVPSTPRSKRSGGTS